MDNAQYFSLFTLVAAAVAAALSAGCGLGAPRPAPPAERAGRAGTQRRHCQAIAAPADGLVLGWAGLASGEETTDLENL